MTELDVAHLRSWIGRQETLHDQVTRFPIVALSATAGHWLLMIAFGFFFASGVQSYLSALNERLEFVIRFFGLAG